MKIKEINKFIKHLEKEKEELEKIEGNSFNKSLLNMYIHKNNVYIALLRLINNNMNTQQLK